MSSGVISGHIDGLQGSHIVGWAISPKDKYSKISVRDQNGRALAEGAASTRRPDLEGVSSSGRALAFRIALPALDGVSALHVLSGDKELPNSPFRVGAGLFDGSFSQRRGVIEGFVTERLGDFAAPDIVIHDQDGNVVMACPSFFEDDSPPAKFYGELLPHCFGAGELLLSARANGVWFADVVCPPMQLNGTLEVITPQRCAGWLLSSSAPARSFDIEVYCNDEMIAAGKCEKNRSDVQDAFPGSLPNTGFDITLPVPRGSGVGFLSLSFRLPGSKRELFDGPFVLGSRSDLVVAARNAARLAHDTNLGLSPGEKAVLQAAMSDFIVKARGHDRLVFRRQARHGDATPAVKATTLNVIIPIYRGIDITRDCIDSVLATRLPGHRVVLVNDQSPEAGMAEMLQSYVMRPDLYLLTNTHNLGFIKSVNRALSFCKEGDVLLLNSDTKLFAGGLEELCHIAAGFADVGTVTAMSNNATIFSYPHTTMRGTDLDDIGWDELAATALRRNRGIAIGSPTGHGFCLLVKREILDRVGTLDEAFGRGYGEENDLCARASDLGYRNVAAAGVLVEHRESISFTGDKTALLAANLATLQGRYPEYTPIIMDAERRDVFRAARWPLDGARLMRASQAGAIFTLVMRNSLTGGTSQAITDIEETVGYGATRLLVLSVRHDGFMELQSEAPRLLAVFAPDECENLFSLLSTAHIRLVVVHQLLGFSEQFAGRLQGWIGGRRSYFYAHDYYALCPRVTMINAAAQFCNVAPTDVCTRCLAVGGPHDSSRMEVLTPAEHRAQFARLLSSFDHVITPSESAAQYLRAILPGREIDVIPHPSPKLHYPAAPRTQDGEEVMLLGAIGAHKGSARLLDIAQLARLLRPTLRFRVIGYTDRDDELLRVGNVTITGAYAPEELDGLVSKAAGRYALFLSEWPETYSYTLSEAARRGFIPLVPDIGAPAERVAASGFGLIFPFPIVPAQVLGLITGLLEKPAAAVGSPAALAAPANSIDRTRSLLGLAGKTRAKARS